VISIEPEDKKMGLSIRAAESADGQEQIKAARARAAAARPTLGDIMQEELKASSPTKATKKRAAKKKKVEEEESRKRAHRP